MEEFDPTSTVPDFALFGWPYTGLVTLLALAVYFVLTFRVGLSRGKYQVKPPEIIGDTLFMRAFRIQQNTLEQLMLFLPLLWIAALASNDVIAAGIGALWPISRVIYAYGYSKDPARRMPGFFMGLAVLVVLFLIAAVQLIRSAVAWV